MRRLRQRVAYLNGLAAGLNLSNQSPEGRVLAGVVEVLEAIAEEVERLDERLGELAEYLGELDQDLYDLEESVAGVDDGEAVPAGQDAGDDDEEDEAGAADFEGAVVFDSGIPTGMGDDENAERGEVVDGLILQCPQCGSSYAVARDEMEFDREPEEDENEFEWVCPRCGEVVHDFLPDADVDEDDEPLTGAAAGNGATGSAQAGTPAPF